MSQTKYKLDNNIRGIVIRYCRLYSVYKNSPDISHKKIIKIIDSNLYFIGSELPDEIRRKLRAAIWNSTIDAKKYPYEVWNLPTISRNEFYERKRKFIFYIARDSGLLRYE